MKNTYTRGSEWRKWDLHVHTPASVLNNGFGSNWDTYVTTLFKTLIEKEIAIVGITDYFTIDGYKKIKEEYLANDTKLKTLFSIDEIDKIKKILIIPNIEFRSDIFVGTNSVNFHIIFSDLVPIKDIEEKFLHEIDFVYQGEPQSEDRKRKLKEINLVELGAQLKKEHSEFQDSDLFIGMMNAVVDHKQVSKILFDKEGTFGGRYLFVVMADEDLSAISWNSRDHLTRKVLIQKTDLLFSSNANTRNWALGKTPYTGGEDKFVSEFKTLKPCIHGSDAHEFKFIGYPCSKRGNTAHNCTTNPETCELRFCWIKADPTFEGFMQITYEPEARVFIGSEPEIEIRTRNNPRNYIKSLYVNRVDGYDDRHGKWFNLEKIELNKELVAIVGNKGSGKSAVTDIMGLLGNSHNQKYLGQNGKSEELFSFLNKDKFLKGGLCASNFFGELHWYDGVPNKASLDGNTDLSVLESVEYLPQKYLEKICTNIEDDEFRQKLNEVIFGYIDEKDRYGKTNLESLIKYLATQTEEDIAKARILLQKENEKVVEIEKKLTQEYIKGIEEQLRLKQEEVDAHNNIKPPTVSKPTKDEGTIAKTATKISELDTQISKLDVQIVALRTEQANIAKLNEDLRQGRDTIKRQVEAITTLETTYRDLLGKAGLKFGEVVSVTANYKKLDEFIKAKNDRLEEINSTLLSELDIQNLKLDAAHADKVYKKSVIFQLSQIKIERKKITDTLDGPNKIYQENLKLQKAWQIRYEELIGDVKDPAINTLNWLKNEKNNIAKVYPVVLVSARSERENMSKGIFSKKSGQLSLYNFVKQSIDTEISKYGQDLEGYDISVDAGLRLSPAFFEEFFKYVNQSVKGSFYNVDDGRAVLKKVTDDVSDWQTEKNVFDTLGLVLKLLDSDQRTEVQTQDDKSRDIFKQMKQYKDPIDFYDYLFGLDYLKPKYDLKVDKKDLSELSPGERGGLLLIFYLMLDRRDIPLIIDQPEDNLDNKSIYEILVRFLKKAKRKRQIIMVTHNPNLAVVADAEQIIHVGIDKKDKNDFDFNSGSIENPEINKCVVDILEGTMPAFDNRRLKYRKQVLS